MFHSGTVRIALIVLICAALNVLTVVSWDFSYIVNDGVQQLSTARNWLQGNGFSTDALIYAPHFQGVIPAPQTVWPPGYAFAFAVVSLSGLPLEWAAFLLNIVTHALTAVLVHFILGRMGETRRFSMSAALLFYLMAMPICFRLADRTTFYRLVNVGSPGTPRSASVTLVCLVVMRIAYGAVDLRPLLGCFLCCRRG